jgi:hypothetical protein
MESVWVMGRPHPSHPFIEPILWSTKVFGQPEEKKSTVEKSMFARYMG